MSEVGFTREESMDKEIHEEGFYGVGDSWGKDPRGRIHGEGIRGEGIHREGIHRGRDPREGLL